MRLDTRFNRGGLQKGLLLETYGGLFNELSDSSPVSLARVGGSAGQPRLPLALVDIAERGVTGPVIRPHRQRRGRDYLVVSGRNGRKIEFPECPREIQEFIERVTANLRAIDSLPEPFFEPAALPPSKPRNVPAIAAFIFAALCASLSLLSLQGLSEQLDHVDRHERALKDHSYDKATLRRWMAEAEDEARIEGIKLGVGAGFTLLGAGIRAFLYLKGRRKQRAADEASQRVATAPVR